MDARQLQGHLFTSCMDSISLLYWTANIFATLTVGYTENGKTIMEPKKILQNLALAPAWVL